MGRFLVTHAARVAMVLIVMGSWGGLAHLAGALMRATYRGGLVTLRTASKAKRNARLTRVVATPWMYTLVFILLSTSFVGMGILERDSADFFGFQRHVLSHEYVLNPRYAVLLCACALSAAATAVVRFSRSRVKDAAAYDAAHRWGFAAFMLAGVAGFAFLLLLEAARSDGGPRGGGLPGGPGVATAVAAMVAGDARAAEARAAEAGADLERLRAFSESLPKGEGQALRVLRGRMVAAGFDPETARLASAELRSAEVPAARA